MPISVHQRSAKIRVSSVSIRDYQSILLPLFPPVKYIRDSSAQSAFIRGLFLPCYEDAVQHRANLVAFRLAPETTGRARRDRRCAVLEMRRLPDRHDAPQAALRRDRHRCGRWPHGGVRRSEDPPPRSHHATCRGCRPDTPAAPHPRGPGLSEIPRPARVPGPLRCGRDRLGQRGHGAQDSAHRRRLPRVGIGQMYS